MDRYIFVMEDGEIFTSKIINEGDLSSCDDGYINIVDTQTGTEYYNGEWTALPKVIDHD